MPMRGICHHKVSALDGFSSWTQSEPPRGSGWVHAQLFRLAYGVPTRYREVVLTVSKQICAQFVVFSLSSAMLVALTLGNADC